MCGLDETTRIIIRRVFRRRWVSRDAFSYLHIVSPRKVSVVEIAGSIGASRTSVLGALRGISTGYREEESLEHFGLVTHEKQVVNGRPVTVYSLTRQGFEEKGLMENVDADQKRASIK
ncbi:archaellum operon transcriptional activator EarA family protein [Methanocella conradii]|uniref:archaellum operon transcriptional activator EarA family protein n=1 Tax=Methanocella conradii TaxID=1175444 RepID=UPI0024B34DA2|nr:archaellum operon transcriptional activator EarA family protein [Methanocella conradii]MDI6897875.1 archaellum operon transcriptional activator EarA family protein [Methanocella conradii]